MSSTEHVLAKSASEQNIYFAYICLVNDPNPNMSKDYRENSPSFYLPASGTDEIEESIKVERSRALHELFETHKKHENSLTGTAVNESDSNTPYPTTSSAEESQGSEHEEILGFDNPKILKLTKMKWLSEGEGASPDSSSPCLSSVSSGTSTCSRESEEENNSHLCIGERFLSTILRLDKEHNLFGLSNLAIVGSQPLRRSRKDDIGPVFPQTAIVQICCGKGCTLCPNACCRHKTKSDLPASLKCGGCRSCMGCADPVFCLSCAASSVPICNEPPCKPSCTSWPKRKCTSYSSCKMVCLPSGCPMDRSFGLKIALHRKPEYNPPIVELTPRASCVLQKPMAARTCHHTPHCQPPSSCFPYLMPCYWPARPSAPCSNPARCFHQPPCLPARKRKTCVHPQERCPAGTKCDETAEKTCQNVLCLGKNPEFTKELLSRYGTSGLTKAQSKTLALKKTHSKDSIEGSNVKK